MQYPHIATGGPLSPLLSSKHPTSGSFRPSSKLTSLCSLTLIDSNSNYQFNDDWRPANLTHLDCYYTPFLETLRIDLSYAKSSVLEDDLAELPSLQKFSVQLYQADRVAVMHILRAISMPNVTTLSVKILDGTSFASENLWTVVTGFKHLEILNLKVTCMVYDEVKEDDFSDEDDGDLSDEDDSWYLDELLAFLPDSMKSLSLTLRDIRLRANCDVPFGAFKFKSLRSVRLEECNRLDVNFFKESAVRFKDEEILLEVLEIQKCVKDKGRLHTRGSGEEVIQECRSARRTSREICTKVKVKLQSCRSLSKDNIVRIKNGVQLCHG